MLVSIACSITMFSDIEGALNIFLGILTIIFAIGSCVLYFLFNEYKKWPIVLTLIGLLGISIILTVSSDANLYPICIFCSFIGIVISCGTKRYKMDYKSKRAFGWQKINTRLIMSFDELKKKILNIAYTLGILAGIIGAIYMLFFNKG